MKNRRSKPHFHVAAGLICKNGRVLITRRPEGRHLAGFWEFPGGKQEAGETLERCLEREIQEELGFRVKAGDLLHSLQYEYESKIISLYLFRCVPFQGQPKALEAQDIRWITPQDLSKFKFPPPDRKIIQSISLRGIWQ